MKKKLLAIIAAAALAMPFAGVSALNATDCSVSQSCFVYTSGDIVNFLVSENQVNELKAGDLSVGQKAMIISDEGSSDKYVKALAISGYSTTTSYYDEDAETTPGSLLLKEHLGQLNSTADGSWEYAKRNSEGNIDLSYMTVDDLKAVWGATYDGTKGIYTIDMTKVPSELISYLETQMSLSSMDNLKKGFYTGTTSEDKSKVWVVKFALTDSKITGMTIEQESSDTADYASLPVVYFDKNYDCKDRETTAEYSCYSCGEEYLWTEVGKQADTCTKVENIETKAKCVKNAKTGVEEYIVEFVGVTGICAVALVIAKRKELFKSI